MALGAYSPISHVAFVGARRSRIMPALLALMPVLAILALFGVLAILILVVRNNEREENRLDLIRDTLWVEQTLQFQITSMGELFQRLAYDIGRGQIDAARFAAHARQFMASNPEILAISWRDPVLQPLHQWPGGEVQPGNAALEEALRTAPGPQAGGSIHQPSGTFPLRTGGSGIAMLVPIEHDDKRIGMLVAVIGLDAMLASRVPWWIAEKRAVQVRDGDGRRIAARSRIEPDPDAPTHVITFGTPGQNLFLALASYRETSNVVQIGLIGAMVVLGLVAVAGFAARERHLRRRRAAEAALRGEYAFRRSMEDSITVGMRARDREGRILYVNQAFCRMVGLTPEDLVGRVPPMPYWLPDESEGAQAFNDAVLAGNPPAAGEELTFRRANGERFEALLYEAPLIDADGQQIGWMGSFLDITDRKRTEMIAKAQAEKLQATSRLVTIGEMASLLAHDLNQPLGAIASYTAGLNNRLKAGTISTDETQAALAKIGDSAQRAGLIIRRVQDFVKKTEPQFASTDLAALVTRTMDVYRRDHRPHGARLAANIEPGAHLVEADPVLMEQVLINLIRNAEEAMADQALARRRIDIVVRKAHGEVEILICDRGPGMPPGLEGRAFDPFVTTKKGGMGLGLAICRSIVEAHRGRLGHGPRKGGGTVFSVRVPEVA